MASYPSFTILSSLFLIIQLFASFSQAIVAPENQFTYVNEGDFGDYVVEYNANYRPLNPFNSPFQLCFYNTTPYAFTLALRMGTVRSTTSMRWVWEANRGSPVRENATLKLGSDGNLVLAEANGVVVWQTNTANKGVTGFNLLPNGNMVLYDAKGNFLWQSFDSATDTLLVGQALSVVGAKKLVSRASASLNANGPYSLELGPKGFSMFYKSSNTPRPLVYFSSSDLFTLGKSPLVNISFAANFDVDDITYLGFDVRVADPEAHFNGFYQQVRPNYNATLSYLRLGMDGNIRFFTYNDKVDIRAWEITYTLFSRDFEVTECQLPERCGKFGVCEDNQCVACPSPNGLLGWSKSCEVKKVSCKPNEFQYYKVEGVDHFMSKYTSGDATKESECRDKCTKDCKCLGYFYWADSSRCWIAYDLKTLSGVGNSTHLGFIKAQSIALSP